MSKKGKRNVDRKSSTERLPLACEATPDAIFHFLLADTALRIQTSLISGSISTRLFPPIDHSAQLLKPEFSYQPPAQSQLDPLIRNTGLVQIYPHMRRILLSPIGRTAPKPSYIPSALFESPSHYCHSPPCGSRFTRQGIKARFLCANSRHQLESDSSSCQYLVA